jgi:hypothetical protein
MSDIVLCGVGRNNRLNWDVMKEVNDSKGTVQAAIAKVKSKTFPTVVASASFR